MNGVWEDTASGRFFHCHACGMWAQWAEGWRWFIAADGRLVVDCSEACRMISLRAVGRLAA